MKEIIVIRTADPDGSVFRSILGALQGKNKNIQVLHAADLEPSALTLGDIEIFPEQRRVTKAGVEICLNYGEFSILYCMARCPGRVFSREQLYNAAWGEDYELGTNTVDNTIWRLRNKLEPDPKHPTYIKTVFRVGYKIDKQHTKTPDAAACWPCARHFQYVAFPLYTCPKTSLYECEMKLRRQIEWKTRFY